MTSIARIRLNIQDKAAEVFSDAEIEDLLLESDGSINGATAAALEIMAMTGNGLVKQYSRGDVSVSKATVLEAAAYYRKAYERELADAAAAEAEAAPLGFFVIPRADVEAT